MQSFNSNTTWGDNDRRFFGFDLSPWAMLAIGAVWHANADAQAAAANAVIPAVATPIQHAIAGGRDSYADVVKVV